MAMVGHQVVSDQYLGTLIGTDSSGVQTWIQTYGDYSGGTGNYDGYTAGGDWIYNECWGIAKSYSGSTQDGYVLACGTGIECESGDDNVAECDTDWRRNWRALSI